ncbi:hypothetical protein ACFQ07_31235 [Actinomadura adrarensis]|uniref:Uncharacterized protein n=1 Tax=Actinomadura adrarensis TaxID=1819600 RepID=A0ABW3CQR4_9ACTN
MTLATLYVLAAPIGEEGANSFLETPAGTAVKATCGALGLIIGLVGVVRMMSSLGRGRVGQAFQTLIFCWFLAGLLFSPGLTINAASFFSDVTGKLLCSVSEVAGGDGSCA